MRKSLHRLGLLVFVLGILGGEVLAEGLRFIQNRGQWDREVLYRADLPGGFLFLKKQSLVYVLYDAGQVAAQHANTPLAESGKVPPPASVRAHGVEVHFDGSSSAVTLQSRQQQPERFSYFLGSDASRWSSDVSAFGEVLYKNLYPGIDLRVFAYQSTLKYEFLVQPGADASRIALRYEGASGLTTNEHGQLVVETSVGAYKEAKPYTFQVVNQRTREVPSRFSLEGTLLRFLLPNDYDHSHPLTIDPELIFSSYSGSLSDNWGHTATYDADGNLYSGGTVFGASFPVTVGAYRVQYAGMVDVSLMKFSPDGKDLLYGTFMGGSTTDIPNSLIVNSKGELLVYGTTGSSNFPTTPNAFQRTFGGGAGIIPISGLELPNGCDIFVARLSADGRQLLASTYVGGNGNDGLSSVVNVIIRNYGDSFRGEIVVDQQDNVLVASSTNSDNFPTRDAVQAKLLGRQDAVIMQLSPDLGTLQWSTYFGGSDFEAAFSLKPTPGGDLFVTGITKSTDLPVRPGAYQSELKGTEDGYIAHFKDKKLVQVSYLGTDASDGAYLLDLDPSGNVYVFGLTRGEYPVSGGVYSNARSGQFVHALDPTLSRTIFSTVIGSGRNVPDISPTAFLVNECGNIYLAGWGGAVNVLTNHNQASSTNGMPVTTDALQRTTSGSNFYVAILEAGAKSLLYGTYFGSVPNPNPDLDRGDHVDGGTSRFSKNGVIYHATCACGGTRFPTTPQAWSQTNRSNNCNNAAFKIDIDLLKADFDVYEGTKKDVVQGCAPLALNFLNTSVGGVEYIWQVNGSGFSRDAKESAFTFTRAGEYTVTLQAFNRLTCKRVDIATRKIRVSSLDVVVKGDTTVCKNNPVPLSVAGGTQYKWTPALGLSNPLGNAPVATVAQTTEFKVEVSDGSGCIVTRSVTVTIDDSKPDFKTTENVSICSGQSVELKASGGARAFSWSPPATLSGTSGPTVTAKPGQTVTYTVEAEYADGCRPQKQITVTVNDDKPDFRVSPDTLICAGQPVLLQASGQAVKYNWFAEGVPGALNGTSVTVNPTQTTTYLVEGEYADGCRPQKRITVRVDRSYEPAFEIARSGAACNEPVSYQFLNQTSNAERYEWKVGGGRAFSSKNVESQVYESPGAYVVTLTAYNRAGCALSVSRNLVAEPPLVLPNVITPNGDGKNDTFVVPVANSAIEIYNRWGKRLLKTEDYQNDWGANITNGTYLYEITTPQGGRCKGWIQVLE
jgi:gliding motility-associated-like protein